MYENQTKDVIMNRMLSNISNELDKREGSIIWDTVHPKSIELSQIYLELDRVLRFGFASTTYGEFLDRKVIEAGIERLPSKQSYCNVVFSGDANTVIPGGTVVYTDSGLRYSTLDEYIIGLDGTVIGRVISAEGGAQYNVAINSIINCELTGIEVVNNEPASGGEDEETDERLYERYRIQTQSTANSGSEDNYKQWALENSSVGYVDVVSLWNGPGTVKVIVLDKEKGILPQEVLDEIYNYIETVRPIGARVTVATGTLLEINISITVSLADGQTVETVKEAIENAISYYLKSATQVEPDIKISKIITSIMGTGVITDYSDLLVNGNTVNIPLTSESVPVIGTVVVNV